MKRNYDRQLVLLLFGSALATSLPGQNPDPAPQHEVGLTLGRILTNHRTGQQTQLDLGGGTGLQANYGYRIVEGKTAALYGEVHLLASPQRLVASGDQTLTRDIATLYLTPGIRLKFFPRSAISPYIAAGGGYALYEQSHTRLDGQPNSAPRTLSRGALDFGGGVDAKLWRFVGLRFEIRDFYTGSPAYNAPSVTGGQHNVVTSGGLVLRIR